MKYEVEIKFRVADPEQLAVRLSALGATAREETPQADGYLSHPGREFAATGEALRLRRDGLRNWITYKGPKHAGPTKTREEIEVSLADGPETALKARLAFERLGFALVAEVRKRRRPFQIAYRGLPMEVVLDVAEDIGVFAEVEALAHDETDLPAAQAAVLGLAGELGLTEVEPRSYLRMLLERQQDIQGRNPSGPT
jgi:adenylate cyclase class 2